MKNAPIVVNPTSTFNTPPKKTAAKPARKMPKTRMDAALERLKVARSEAQEALDVGVDMLYSLDPGTLTMTNTLRLLIYTNSTIMALEKATKHLNEVE